MFFIIKHISKCFIKVLQVIVKIPGKKIYYKFYNNKTTERKSKGENKIVLLRKTEEFLSITFEKNNRHGRKGIDLHLNNKKGYSY